MSDAPHAIQRFIDAMRTARWDGLEEAYTEDAIFDASVPNWHFQYEGPAKCVEQLADWFGITPDLIEFISDTTPAKHGTFSPGAHIPVRPHSEFAAKYPDHALLFLWNHAAEVRAKEEAFARAGGRWIVYVPDVREL